MEQKKPDDLPFKQVTNLRQMFNADSQVALSLDKWIKFILWIFGAFASTIGITAFVVIKYKDIESILKDSEKKITAVQNRLDTLDKQTTQYPALRIELNQLQKADDDIRADIRAIRK